MSQFPCLTSGGTMRKEPAAVAILQTTKALRRNLILQIAKGLRRHLRDIRFDLYQSARIRSALCLCLAIILIAFLFILQLLPPRPLFTPAGQCPANAAELTPILSLAHTVLVARVGRRGTLHPIGVLRGPPGAAGHALLIPPRDVVVCGDLRRGSSALLLLGPIAGATHANASIPVAPLFSYARVWAAPWNEWRSALDAKESSGTWWRTRSSLRDAVWRDAAPRSDRAEWWLRDGVTIIAGCMNRPDTLMTASDSWFSVNGVDEIVLVDWSSSVPAVNSLSRTARHDDRLVVVRVEGQKQWALSRAYNLAIQLASRNIVLKVDCDTRLHADFIAQHPLRNGQFYAGDWRALHTPLSEHLHVNGLLLARRDDLLAVGGYDERITTYGWDDSDIAQRLSQRRRQQHLRFNYSIVEHIPHPPSLRIVHQAHSSILPPTHPHAAAVEIQRNRILLTRCNLPIWRNISPRMVWDIELRSTPYARSGGGVFGFSNTVTPAATPKTYVASSARDVSSATELISESDALDVAKRAIRVVLSRYGVPVLPKTLSLNFYKRLSTKVAYPHQYAEVAISLRGGCLARLVAHSAAVAVTSAHESESSSSSSQAIVFDNAGQPPPPGFIGWRLRQYWSFPSDECNCRFYDAFQATRSEISSTWTLENPKSQFRAYQAGILPSSIRDILKTYNTHSSSKILPPQTIDWTLPSSDRSSFRILMAQLSCDISPQNASTAHTIALRTVLRDLTPSDAVRTALQNSLQTPIRTVLDAPELRITAWPNLVGRSTAQNITATFSNPALHGMANKWGGNPAAQPRFLLQHRAGALVIAMRLARNSAQWEQLIADHDAQHVKRIEMIVFEIEKRFEKLFHGCPYHSSRYLDAYPELAIVLAALLSANFCMS